MNRNNSVLIIFGVLILLIGIILKLFIGRRRFYRRNAFGGEGFKNYRSSLLTPFLENVINILAVLFIILGIISLVFAKLMS